jgi:hypothetical protein
VSLFFKTEGWRDLYGFYATCFEVLIRIFITFGISGKIFDFDEFCLSKIITILTISHGAQNAFKLHDSCSYFGSRETDIKENVVTLRFASLTKEFAIILLV